MSTAKEPVPGADLAFRPGFFDRVRVVVACANPRGLPHFRTDRIGQLTLTDTRYPRRRLALLKDWRATEGIRNRNFLLLTVFGNASA